MDEREIDLLYDNYYFKLNKKLQILTGLWPYKSRKYKLSIRAVVYVILSLMMIPLLKNVYRLVAKNWMEITDPHEHEILVNYAKQGRLKTIGYTAYMIVAGIGFSQIPMISVILDIIMPLNVSRPKRLFVGAEFIIDPYQHFYQLYVYFIITSFVTITITIAIDTNYTAIIHHILGLLTIIKYRLQRLKIPISLKKDNSYYIIIKTIHLHNDALQFIDLIESSYSYSFLVFIGFTIIIISLGTFVIMTQIGTFLNMIRVAVFVLGASLNFVYISWTGQLMIDHSKELYLSVYSNEWYNLTKEAKTLLKIVMLRCLKPSTFTAGGLYTLNLENFGSIMESALTYIAIMSSYR